MAQEPSQIEPGLSGTSLRTRVNEAMVTVATSHYGPNDPNEIVGEVVEEGYTWIKTSVTPHEFRLYYPTAGTADGWVVAFYINPTTGAVTPSPAVQALIDASVKIAGSIDIVNLTMLAGYIPSTALQVATKGYVDATSRPPDVRVTIQGVASVQNKVAQAIITRACKFSSIRLYADTAPAGSSLTVVVTRKRTAAADVTRSASLTAGSNAVSTAVTNLDLLAGDRLQFDISAVGSTTAGGDDLLIGIPMDPP